MTGIASSAIGRVALNGKYMTYDHWDREPLLRITNNRVSIVAQLKQPLKGTFVDDIYQKGKAQQRVRQLAGIGFDNGRLAPVDHHTAHAAAAYYGSGWKGKVLCSLVMAAVTAYRRRSTSVKMGEWNELRRFRKTIPSVISMPWSRTNGHDASGARVQGHGIGSVRGDPRKPRNKRIFSPIYLSLIPKSIGVAAPKRRAAYDQCL